MSLRTCDAANVETTRELYAIASEAAEGASGGNNADDSGPDAWSAQDSRGNTIWPRCNHRLPKIRRFYPCIDRIGVAAAQAFIGKEKESSIPAVPGGRTTLTKTWKDNRSADAAAKLVQALIHSDWRSAIGTTVFIESV